MRVGLMADTHDNSERTRMGLKLLDKHDPELILHAGDLNTGASVALYDGWRVLLAEGNVDKVRDIRRAIREHDVDVHYDVMHELPLDDATIGLIHGDDEGRLEGMINAGAFDLVVHGHTHGFRDETFGDTRVVNPGALHRAKTPSVCVWDSETDELTRVEVPR